MGRGRSTETEKQSGSPHAQDLKCIKCKEKAIVYNNNIPYCPKCYLKQWRNNHGNKDQKTRKKSYH